MLGSDGPNVITFSFYQPTQPRSQFCEDVPETGPTTIVVDTMQNELRDMVVEMRVIEADASEDENGAQAEAYLPPSRFQTGVIELEHDFKKRNYVALVRARSEDGRKEYNARFAFSVGEEFLRDWYAHAFGKGRSKKRNSKMPESLFGKWKTGGIERSALSRRERRGRVIGLLSERIGRCNPLSDRRFQMAEISPLRRRMIEDMTVRNLSPATQQSYIHAVSRFSQYFGHSPDRLVLEDRPAAREAQKKPGHG
jgi:hypothetical protein